MSTRRQFLARCSVLAAGAGLASPALLAAPWPSQVLALHEISFQSFAQQAGTLFSVKRKSAPAVRLKLIEAKSAQTAYPNAHLAEDAQNEKFSLRFRGPAGAVLDQDTHLFEHAELGRFAMFIVPVGPQSPGHAYYEAVFNRPAPGALI